MTENIIDDEILQEFINESREHLAKIEENLLIIEEDGENINKELVNEVFRAAHSIKGGSGYFGLNKVKDLAHKAETVLDMIRNKKMIPSPEITNLLLSGFDQLRTMINDVGNSENIDINDLLKGLIDLADSYKPHEQKQPVLPVINNAEPVVISKSEPTISKQDYDTESLEEEESSINSDPEDENQEPMQKTEEPETENLLNNQDKTEKTKSAPQTKVAKGNEETLRVNVKLLENLMNLAGELVLSRNQLRAAVAKNNKELLVSVDQRVNQVTSELQDVIMQTRLQPIGIVFSKFPRVVRDLSMSLDKEIELEIHGKNVALDKTLIEGLSDPLTHMVRNAVDHGIETKTERIRLGKKPLGKVTIAAKHEAGQVVIEISDDGKGIDGDKVAEAAIAKSLITHEKVIALSQRDKQALVFLPGLSTSQIVSDVSGRGVGMDVVKTNLDSLGGQVEIISEMGKGSLFRIKLPLTLAIIPSLIVSLDKERFAIPQTNIEELLRVRPSELKNRIEIVGDSEVLLLRDQMLPLARLSDIIGIISTYTDPTTGEEELDRRTRLADRRSPRHSLDSIENFDKIDQAAHLKKRKSYDRRTSERSNLEIAVVTTGTMSYAIVVDAFFDTEEVVVKPLGRRLKHLREYSGATILGDGTVALILDVSGMAEKAGLSSVSGSARATEIAALAEAEKLEETHSLLLFQNGPNESCALPLDLVQRIEKITSDKIEHLGTHKTMQYRGGSLPLVSLSDASNLSEIENQKDLVVLVSSIANREVGLLGSMPLDVIEEKIKINNEAHKQTGIIGSTLIREKTTLIADLYELVDAVFPDWREARKELNISRKQTEQEWGILLAEDSDFFRTQVKKFLEEDGFKVFAAPDGEAAWELLLENIKKINIVVTDIEMPRLNGLGLASRIKADERTCKLPIIAVTSLAADEDIKKGKECGIDDYQVKLDRDQLLQSVNKMLHVG